MPLLVLMLLGSVMINFSLAFRNAYLRTKLEVRLSETEMDLVRKSDRFWSFLK